jgi:hypothetical protein
VDNIPGQLYLISDPIATADLAIPVEAGAFDIFSITPAANVPVYVGHILLDCGVNAAVIQKASLVKRSTAGSGGTGLTIRNSSPAGPAASMSAVSTIATPGTIVGGPIACKDWQQFAELEFDYRDFPLLVVPGETLALLLPNVPAGFTCNVNIRAKEVK